MAADRHRFATLELRGKPREAVQRRRRRQSAKIQKNIDDDVFMASAIGDVTWLQQSLYDPRKAYATSKEHGLAPIHIAAQNGQLDCLKVMTERYRIDVNFQSTTGWTPLHLAINKSNRKRGLKCVRYLLEKGADPSIPTNTGITPVHQAANEGHVKCLQELIKAGGKIDAVDSNGHTPMTLARVWGNRECARILANQQWYLEKQKYIEEKLESERQAKQLAAEMQKLSIIRLAEGKHESQLAFKRWLYHKRIPDIATMYGPIPTDERKALKNVRAGTSLLPSPVPMVTASSFVVRSKTEYTPFSGGSLFVQKSPEHHDHDADKRLELIPLERISASKRRKGQRTEGLRPRAAVR